MYESLLPKKARLAYRLSPWKDRLDERAASLFAWGYLRRTVGYHLREWMAFLRSTRSESRVSD